MAKQMSKSQQRKKNYRKASQRRYDKLVKSFSGAVPIKLKEKYQAPR